MRLILYGTAACHLCEAALAQVSSVAKQYSLEFEELDIALDDKLLEDYGLLIPVLLRTDSGALLKWPFMHEDIVRLISN